LEYLALREKSIPVPALEDGDPRCVMLAIGPGTDPARDPPGMISLQAKRPVSNEDRHRSEETSAGIRRYLEQMKKEDLIHLLEDLMSEYPDVWQEVSDRRSIAASNAGPVRDALLVDIESISHEEAWSNSWTGDSQIPDYSRVRKRMEMLLSMGEPDMVVETGGILLEKATAQIETSEDDTGEITDEISSCMDLVFAALRKSSRPAHKRMLFAIHALLDDEFDLCEEAGTFLEETWPAAEWGLVADHLVGELKKCGIPQGRDDFSATYRRDKLAGWIVQALDRAGREGEATDLCADETGRTGNYTRLVCRLIDLGQKDEAVRWINKGIRTIGKTWPGTARDLMVIRRKIWEKEGDCLHVAGMRAEEFLCDPSYRTYSQLKSAAGHAGVWDAVNDQVRQYLTGGRAPALKRDRNNEATLLFGVLPLSSFTDPKSWRSQETPFFNILIDSAIADRQPDEVIRWYDRLQNERQKSGLYYSPDDAVADAVAERFPERALAIWRRNAERLAAEARPKSYEASVGYLKKIRALMEKEGRKGEWEEYLLGLRNAHARKKKFLEMLVVLEGKKILKS
jgi:uncharacterized Zn finger protein